MDTQHSPTPWTTWERAEGTSILGERGRIIADCSSMRPEHRANAAFIVRAVNSHDALLEAGKEALDALEGHNLNAMVEPANQLRAAIAAAKGG